MFDDNIFNFYEVVKDDLKFYGISSVRMNIMIGLSDGPKKTRQLRELTGIPSSTILHGINELEKQKVVYKDGDIFRLSEIGHILALKLIDLVKTICTLKNNQKLWLNHKIGDIPDDLLMEIGNLSNSQLIEAENADVFKTYNEFTYLLLQSKDIKGVSPFFHADLTKIFLDILDKGVKVELILSDAVLKKIIRSFNPKSLTDFLKFRSSENLNLWVLNEEVEMAFTVTDKFLSFGLYTDNGVYDTSKDLISEDPAAILWGNKLFDYYREKSDKIELKRLYKIISHLIR